MGTGCDFLRFVEVENDLFLPLPFEEIPFRPVAIGAGCNVNAVRLLQFVEIPPASGIYPMAVFFFFSINAWVIVM